MKKRVRVSLHARVWRWSPWRGSSGTARSFVRRCGYPDGLSARGQASTCARPGGAGASSSPSERARESSRRVVVSSCRRVLWFSGCLRTEQIADASARRAVSGVSLLSAIYLLARAG